MTQYPHDEFDDVDENSKRRGVYRAHDPRQDVGKGAFFSMFAAGAAALLLGGFMYVYSPQTNAPDAQETTAAEASTSPSGEESASAEPTAKATGESIPTAIYNSGGVTGAASDAMNLLMASDANVTITQVANWQGTPVMTSIVFYSAGNEEIANTVADAIGIEYIQEDPTQDVPVVAVLGPEYVLSSLRAE